MSNKSNNNYLIHTILAGTVVALVITGGSAAKNKKSESRDVKLETGLFAPGEHTVAVAIDDPTKQINIYEGHVGYKPVEIYPKYKDSYILYTNTITVQADPTGVDKDGNKTFYNFGTPIYEPVRDADVNEYAAGEHIISIPYSFDDNEIVYYDGYDIVGISRASYGKEDTEGCILYVNNETVEYVYDAENNSYFGTPVEKAKVLEK